MRIKVAALGLVCAGIGAASLIAWASEPQAPAAESVELATLMHVKLASSQKITEGLVTKDFDLIRRGATEWRRVTAATKWYSHNDPVFLQYRAELGRNADKLIRATDEKNLDAAAYTYTASLTTCIACHEYSRDVLHVPARRNPRAVQPIPDTDEEPATPEPRVR
jgi:cytochrome c553